MADDDLIRRGDVLPAALAAGFAGKCLVEAIAAIPAVTAPQGVKHFDCECGQVGPCGPRCIAHSRAALAPVTAPSEWNAAIEALISERDYAQEMADKLAFAIGGDVIGEHSNMNCPWQNALEIADLAPAQPAPDAPDLLSIVERFVALPSGAWHPERHAAEEAELMRDARAILALKRGGA